MNEKLKQLLHNEGYTCILMNQEEVVLASFEKGIMPLYQYITEKGVSPVSLELGDKIIGRAAALLALHVGVKSIYTPAISQGALELLNTHQISVAYDEIVPFIFNRMKNGQCPMETAVELVSDPEIGFEILDQFIKNRKKS